MYYYHTSVSQTDLVEAYALAPKQIQYFSLDYVLIKALQALHVTTPLCLILLLRMFWHKNINVSTRFDQINQLFYKILSINIILKSIKR